MHSKQCWGMWLRATVDKELTYVNTYHKFRTDIKWKVKSIGYITQSISNKVKHHLKIFQLCYPTDLCLISRLMQHDVQAAFNKSPSVRYGSTI